MSHPVHPVGNQVRVTSYGPFRGLKGTILSIDQIIDDLDEPYCFYLVALEGASVGRPVWFEYHEVEFVGLLVSAVTPQGELVNSMSEQS